MTTLQLGFGAYRREAAAAPEIKCINRFVEKAPTNLVEHTMLLARPGTNYVDQFPGENAADSVRGMFSEIGMFGSNLFIVTGENLWRYDGVNRTHVLGQVHLNGQPRMAFVKGAGYERLWLVDGQALYWYDGGSPISTYIQDDGSAAFTGYSIQIGDTWYGWTTGSVDAGTPDGTAAKPYLVPRGAGAAAPWTNVAKAINLSGVAGTDYSTSLYQQNVYASAVGGADRVTLTSRFTDRPDLDPALSANDPHMVVQSPTLNGGGIHALTQVPLPDDALAAAVASLNSFVFVSVADSQRFYFIRPGEKVIDVLDFATKESAPDAILDLVRLGDVMLILGAGSTEFWQATGDNAAPFAPVVGRTLSRGCVDGTAVAVTEGVAIMVGNDYRVYALGAGLQRISDHGIEERIRRQLRREKGLQP